MQVATQVTSPDTQVKTYDLFLDLDFQALKFSGRLAIDLESQDDITLDAIGLEITSVKANGRNVPFELSKDSVLVRTGRFSGSLEIEYTGPVPDALVGIYKAPYGENEHIITTQFESHHARRLLPCIDHPSFKAEFKLAVKLDRDLSVISNMPGESSEEADGKKVVKFQKTPRMSSYLLYLGVGNFKEDHATHGKVSIVAATVKGSKTKVETGFATEVAKNSLRFFESYFDIPYVLPKLHLVGVPEFAHGAMENWGAITFREVALHAGKDSSVREKKEVAITVAHEVAHMWFGNLVTMKWWDDLWLNESFATFVSYKAVDAAYPDWKIWQDFPFSTAAGMSRDGLKSTHPIEAKVRTPEEIESLVDEITYNKGAGILRMIEAYITPESFMKGIRAYLNSYKYANASGQDLWNSLQQASDTEATRLVEEWIRKPGFPVVTASIAGDKLVLEQERFLLTGEKEKGIWPVPVTMRVNGETRRFLLDKQKDQIPIPHVKSLKLNVDQAGFYRVHYKGSGLQNRVWADKELSPFDRWGLANDAWAFLQSGKIRFNDYRNLVKRFINEESYLPAYEISDELGQLYQISPKTANLSRDYHRSQLKILETRKDDNSRLLHGAVAARLARVDDEYAGRISSKFGEIEKVEPDMKRAVSIGYARTTNDFEGILTRYRNATTDEDKETYLQALLAFKDPALAAMSLGLAFTGDVKKQDVLSMPLYSLQNPESRDILWIWFKTNVERLGRLLEGTSYLSYLLRRVIPVVGIGRQEEVWRFFNENKLDGADAAMERLTVYDKLAKSIVLENEPRLSPRHVKKKRTRQNRRIRSSNR